MLNDSSRRRRRRDSSMLTNNSSHMSGVTAGIVGGVLVASSLQASKKYCRFCGTQINTTANYCKKCGKEQTKNRSENSG